MVADVKEENDLAFNIMYAANKLAMKNMTYRREHFYEVLLNELPPLVDRELTPVMILRAGK